MTEVAELLIRDRLRATPMQAKIIHTLYKSDEPVGSERFCGSAKSHLKVWIWAIRQVLGQGTVMGWGHGTYSLTPHGREIVRGALDG